MNSKRAEFLLWVIIFIVLCHAFAPLFTLAFSATYLPAGRDILAHYYLSLKAYQLLQAGQIYGYDPLWYGGYSLFTQTPPFYYFLSILPAYVTGGMISPQISICAVNFCLPFLFLLSLKSAARSFISPESGTAAVLLGFLVLLLPAHYAQSGVGLAAQLQVGYFPSLLAWPLLLFCFVQLEEYRKQRRVINLILSSLCGALAIVSSLSAAFFGLFACMIYCSACGKKAMQSTLSMLSLALIACSFWLVPGWYSLSLNSGDEVFSLWESTDALFALYPELAPQILIPQLKSFWLSYLHTSFNVLDSNIINLAKQLLVVLPLTSLLLLILSVPGIILLCRKQSWFIPALFLTALVVLPRGLLENILQLQLHRSKFIPPLMILNILCAAASLVWLLQADIYKRFLPTFGYRVFCTLLAPIIVISVWRYELPLRALQDPAQPSQYKASLTQFPHYKSALKMIEHIVARKPTGRVLDENPSLNWSKLGTPYFFSTLLPLYHSIPVANGFATEAATLAEFINAASYHSSKHIHNGPSTLWKDPKFVKQSFRSMLNRLNLFSVEYILASSRLYARKLLRNKNVRRVERVGRFSLFQVIKYTKPQLSSRLPFLYLDHGLDFRKFSQLWYTTPQLQNYSIISSANSYEQLSTHEQSKIAGIIIGWNKPRAIYKLDLAEWRLFQKPLIIINGYPGFGIASSEYQSFIPRIQEPADRVQLAGMLSTLSKRETQQSSAATLTISLNHNIAAGVPLNTNEPVQLPFSYSPDFKVADGSAVFNAAPGFIFVIPAKNTQLKLSHSLKVGD